MGVYIRLKAEESRSDREQSLGRIAYGGEAWEAFSGWFRPIALEYWRNSTLPELGGKQMIGPTLEGVNRPSEAIGRIADYFRGRDIEELINSIIVVRGVWKIDEFNFPGYVSINNNLGWRTTYSDIEVDGYTNLDRDFANIVLDSKDMGEGFYGRLMEKLTDIKHDAVKLAAVYFYDGPLSRSEVYNARLVYYHSLPEVIADFLTSYKADLKDAENRTLLNKLNPYREQFLIASMLKNHQFMRELNSAFNNSQIVQTTTKSVLLVGKKDTSFKQAYDKMAKEVFQSIANNLPSTKQLAQKIDEALGGMASLDELTKKKAN